MRQKHQRWFLAFDPDHDRQPIPFSPTHGQCLQVGRDCCRNPRRKGTFSSSYKGDILTDSRHFAKKIDKS
jgi:hypothetical protein